MSEMVRKQFYIHRRHQILLKRLARARGVSEAEIIRQAIEREAAGNASQPRQPDRSAWEEVLDFVGTRSAGGAAYQWKREDAYQHL